MIHLIAYIIYLVTGGLILLYLLYPFCLLACKRKTRKNFNGKYQPQDISVVLLTQNGGESVNDKIRFLLEELQHFRSAELILIDDCSTDKTRQILDSFSHVPRLRIVKKHQQLGIPHSMNLGVEMAKNENIVFCDQRQKLLDGCLNRILLPLQDVRIGAVSGCISQIDKANCSSVARIHENFLKGCEGRMGKLMGVYGNLYAIKKSVYAKIPDHIILDDLYLSLSILSKKQIVMAKNCAIIDERFSKLYDYNRAKRYLRGLLQIISNKQLIKNLGTGKLVMLLLHKYLRIVITLFLFLCFIVSIPGIALGKIQLVIFVLMTTIGTLVVAQMVFGFKSGILDTIRINFYYLLAFGDLLFGKLQRMFSISRNNATQNTQPEPYSVNLQRRHS